MKRDAIGEIEDQRLRSRIGDLARGSPLAIGGRDIDDCPAMLGHGPYGMPASQKGPQAVDVHGRAPVVFALVRDRAGEVDSGVVDHRGQRTQRRSDMVDRRPPILVHGDVETAVDGSAQMRLRQRLAARIVDVGDQDPRALGDKSLDDGQADPPRAAGDQCDAPLQKAHRTIVS
jgi:hypothetical protein